MKRVLRESLEEGSFEQQSLWQLVLAHRDIKIENWIQVLPSIQSDKHSEVLLASKLGINSIKAILAIRQQLEHCEPSDKVCRMLFARDEDELVVSSLFHWAKQGREMRSKLIDSLTR